MFQKGLSRNQKIVAAIVVLPTLSCVAYVFFGATFLPEEQTSRVALIVSVGLIVLGGASLALLKRRGSWQPSSAWSALPSTQRILALLLGPVILIGVYWVNLANAIPHLLTSVTGVPGSDSMLVERSRESGRYSFCDYRVNVKSLWRSGVFRWCVPRRVYEQLPVGEFLGEFAGRRSSLGLSVTVLRPQSYDRGQQFGERGRFHSLERAPWRASITLALGPEWLNSR